MAQKATSNSAFDLSRVRTRIIDHIALMPGDILDHPGQAWDHPAAQAKALVGILEEVGIVDEILVYKSERAGGAWVTPDGHLRKSLDPRKPWPCTVLDLTDAEADYVLATKDPVGMMKRTNAEALDALLSSVESSNKAVQEMLADVAAKAGLYLERGSVVEPAEPKTERAAELLAEWQVAPGQIWQLGQHRLLCGDSTDTVAVERLLADASAEITFTSPPYNVAAGSNLPNKDKYKQERDKCLQGADALDTAAYLQFLLNFTNLALAKSQYVFVNMQSVAGNKLALIEYLYQMRARYADTLIWDKQSAEPAMAHNVLNSRFEYVHVFSHKANRSIGAREFRGTVDNVLALNSRQGNANADLHKAVFPLDFAAWFIERFSNAGSMVYEPFCGTGTTLLACAQLGRIGRAMEIEPVYVAITLQRWLDTFGVRPELLDG